ncbi:MAG: squalene synthase HpnD [Verrucomicrobia bacterium]|nr:MAG: squalene synthase HpnD [Verrucomicrobiota bacterium]
MSAHVSQSITRKSASNLALAFVLLPKAKRNGMAALYAFCRQVDDLADEDSVPVEQRRQRLAEWRDDIRKACDQASPLFPVNQELAPIIARYRLPFGLFDELIRGVEMDLDIKSNPRCRDYAVLLGKALQLTNILRDVRADAERGRIYLPLEELERCSVRPEEILRLEYSPRFGRAAASVADRARDFYRQAREALPDEERRSMGAAELMGSVYWRLLQKLETQRFNVFDPATTRVSKPQKLFLIFRTWYRLTTGALVPNYGTP